MPSASSSSVSYNVPGWSQPKANACWYTSLQMVISYFRNGGVPIPKGRLTDPSEDDETQGLYDADNGIPWSSTARIARKLGFTCLLQCTTADGIADLMIAHGPLIYAGQWPGCSCGHWVVFTGISGNSITMNDPYYGPRTVDYDNFVGQYLTEEAQNPLIVPP